MRSVQFHSKIQIRWTILCVWVYSSISTLLFSCPYGSVCPTELKPALGNAYESAVRSIIWNRQCVSLKPTNLTWLLIVCRSTEYVFEQDVHWMAFVSLSRAYDFIWNNVFSIYRLVLSERRCRASHGERIAFESFISSLTRKFVHGAKRKHFARREKHPSSP